MQLAVVDEILYRLCSLMRVFQRAAGGLRFQMTWRDGDSSGPRTVSQHACSGMDAAIAGAQVTLIAALSEMDEDRMDKTRMDTSGMNQPSAA